MNEERSGIFHQEHGTPGDLWPCSIAESQLAIAIEAKLLDMWPN